MNLAFYIAISVALNTSGQILLKKGMEGLAMGGVNSANPVVYILKTVTSPTVFAGLSLYAISMLFYLHILSKADVSLAYPIIVSLTFVSVTVSAMTILDEQLSLMRVLGITIIAIGVFLVAQT